MADSPSDDDPVRLSMTPKARAQLDDLVQALELFGGDDDEIDAAKQRHPATPEPELCGRRLPKSPWQLIWPRCTEPKGHDGPHWTASAINVVDPEQRL